MEHLQLKDPKKQVLSQSGFPEATLPLGLPHLGQGPPSPPPTFLSPPWAGATTTCMRTSRGCLLRTCYSRRVAHHRWGLAETQAEGWGFMGERRGGVRWVLPGACRRGRLQAGSLEVRRPGAPAEGRVLAFLWLVLSWKWGSCQLRIKSRHLGPMAAGMSVWGPGLTDLAVGCLCI